MTSKRFARFSIFDSQPWPGPAERTAVVRVLLGSVLAFAALSAFGGGVYGLAGAAEVPREWLAGSPFEDYFVPSFVLLVIVGGSLLSAAVAVFARAPSARRLTLAAGALLALWIAIQIAIIGYVSWLQPATAIAASVIVALGSALPKRSSSELHGLPSFGSYYFGLIRRPRATFDALLRDERGLRFGAYALFINAALYTLVYAFLVMGHGRPTVFKPWLAIDPESYYRWNLFFVAPSMVMAWLVASAVTQLLARRFGGIGAFEDTLSVLGFGVAIGSWWTLLHDLVTTFLGAIRVIDQRAYEDAMSSPTIFRANLWFLMFGYLVTFVLLFSKGIAAAQRTRRTPSLLLGAIAFVSYQLVFVLFNR